MRTSMQYRILTLAFAASLGGLTAASASAQGDPAEAIETPEVIDDMFACREVEDPDARLACFDREVAKVYNARASRELVIADREQVRETKKGLFGFKLPKLGLFGSDDNTDAVNQITATLVSARKLDNGRYIFELEEGARWLETESVAGYRRFRAGDTIVIKKAALGSFKAKVNGKKAVRVLRLN